MQKLTQTQVKIFAWSVSAIVAVLGFVVWGQGVSWEVSELSLYQLFPLFGLLAFSLMWAHYVAAALRKYSGIDKDSLKSYFEITSILVLVFMLLHPGLLAYQLWQDGLGLPPGSYFQFVSSALKISIIAGMISWLAFIAYEFRRKFNKQPWWRYVQYASDAAMLLIFVHALRLGGNLQSGWFRYVWLVYGISLFVILSYTYIPPKKKA